jgi:hypothetical protein
MSVALPSKLLYQSKIESAAARSYRSNISPTNGLGPYNPTETIMINIPTRNNLVLTCAESYLKFTAYVFATAATDYLRLDSGGAHGFIQRIRVFHGSNLISDIDQYALLAKMMFDIQQSPDACYGKNSVLAGTRSDLTCAVGVLNSNYPVNQTNSGYRFQSDANKLANTYATHLANATTAVSTATASQTFCINLLSIVGTVTLLN